VRRATLEAWRIEAEIENPREAREGARFQEERTAKSG
jgi:hypothetical protein